MVYLIIIFGAVILIAGIIIIFNPDYIFGFLKKHIAKLGIHIVAIVIRLLLGAKAHEAITNGWPLCSTPG